ncbi:1-deoxy-D-xylulose 5-phosphate reductoisomerase [Planococcus glaciei]|uniref:1-deoxy-D-xylulose 5-phosphate reductoisomerase n=1 Tax=Planococcus glaciei TaxID=459472 RepID=A0A1G8AMC7_9BACL|nr:1-deoxy-D-xylulose-5-phosphate reductoisomerase [Planococcus glaciei]ETP68774.1 1-deoxy-D-xylulose 5-phosphate reductoisomerase [Planococcus glaciei CHR43]KOF10413.1 1-deoxy-D-xylulose 5-phosphate reductoisomerase [Planococcus glaciei]MBX0313762.1 1-deoxy-D-xylulose-5-phosphate reductoisomerase [Planococcus glaciei]QKX49098.1 1-deoxy-D-xylulose-5-phosphate reductoisomerase [Planococcus glaciei]QKX52541.1 1-deoxy-D-xylulose-5-phosphate reductoisomerase [Planococcus glaciei]
MAKSIILLGATGSIGVQTADIIREHPEDFSLTGFAAGKNMAVTRDFIREFHPEIVCVQNDDDAVSLRNEFPGVHVVSGDSGLIETATYEADVLVNAVLGSVGLKPTLEAIKLGRTVAIANKETLVTAGHLVMQSAKEYGATILPVDSEHSALFQSLNGEKREQASRLILTASGGSFRDSTRDDLKNVTVKEALNHPNWSMGAKITIDSATMVNKGLEVIEAHVLFDFDYNDIDVLLHRESIIHSMVEFQDTSVMAQLGTPDMRVPIQYALTYPDRLPRPEAKRLNLAEIGKLHFQEMDYDRFRALKMAFEAGRAGGTMTTVLNAANEQAVAMFLNEEITFLQIEELIERAMHSHQVVSAPDLETILYVDAETRKSVKNMLK